MKTVFNWFGDDWKRVKNHCRTTDNKDFTENEATDTFKRSCLYLNIHQLDYLNLIGHGKVFIIG